MHNPFARTAICVFGGPEFLNTESHGIVNRQFMDSHSTRTTVSVCALFLEAGDPECRKIETRDTNAQTLYEKPSQTYYYMC